MAVINKKLLDKVGWELLAALQEDARLTFAELGRRVGLSLPAVAERVRRLEEAEIIEGYHAQVNTRQVGLPITAFVCLHTGPQEYERLLALLKTVPEVMECHHLSGVDSFIIKLVVSDIPHLEKLIGKFGPFGQTTTSIVLSSPVVRRPIAQFQDD